MTLRDDWHAWLGPAADTITDTQLDRLDTASTAIDARWPDPDDTDERREALNAAAQIILGDDTLEEIAAAWHRARRAEVEHRAALAGALIASATGANRGPGSEAVLATRAGTTRATVRKALNK